MNEIIINCPAIKCRLLLCVFSCFCYYSVKNSARRANEIECCDCCVRMMLSECASISRISVEKLECNDCHASGWMMRSENTACLWIGIAFSVLVLCGYGTYVYNKHCIERKIPWKMIVETKNRIWCEYGKNKQHKQRVPTIVTQPIHTEHIFLHVYAHVMHLLHDFTSIFCVCLFLLFN